MAEKTSTIDLTPQEVRLILALRLLIARAANSDSLAWWDDESLTPAADYVLNRLFPMAPRLAGKSLALRAAAARHRVACPGDALHLYRLDVDSRDKLALRFAPLKPVTVPDTPIATMKALREQLLEVVDGPQAYTALRQTTPAGLLIDIPPAPADVPPIVHRAKTLAWAYLEGAQGAPVFPFSTE
jgi:hypothetical protein